MDSINPKIFSTARYFDIFLFLGCGTGYFSTYPGPASCACEPCPVGTYNDDNGAEYNVESCTTCPLGHTTSQEGSINSSQCVLCPIGTYIDINLTCTSCPEYHTTLQKGSTTSLQCHIGRHFCGLLNAL